MSETQQKEKKWEDLTDEEIDKAFKLIVERNDLHDRKVQIAVLKAIDMTPEHALEQIADGRKCYVDGLGVFDF